MNARLIIGRTMQVTWLVVLVMLLAAGEGRTLAALIFGAAAGLAGQWARKS